MTPTDPALMSAETLLALYARRALSPVEALQAVMRRVAELNPWVNAFAAMNPRALAASGESEARWAAGRPIGPLDGVPATVKDLLNMAGFPTRRGSRTTAAEPATEDAPAVLGLKVRRRRHHRQDHHHRVRLEDAGRLPAARHHPQPLEPRAHAGRLLLRRRRGGRRVLRAAASRHRRRRLHPHPGGVLRAGRDEALLRPGAAMAARRLLRRGLRRADGAHGARRGADALRHGAARPPRPVLPARRAARLARTASRRASGACAWPWCAASASTRRSTRKARPRSGPRRGCWRRPAPSWRRPTRACPTPAPCSAASGAWGWRGSSPPFRPSGGSCSTPASRRWRSARPG